MGRYVPPDQEGVLSFNQASKKNAISPTVRFEMPYPIWCTTCPKPTIIGQGVRFNAYKSKVGNYYSTPIFAFRMKHVACGGWIEIRTDPKNTAYVVTEGARKRDLGENKVEEGGYKVLTEAEREEMRNNAFKSLEIKVGDRERAEVGKVRIEELIEAQEIWKDPGERNRELRRAFRAGRKAREKDGKIAASLQDKMSFGYEIVPESMEDVRRAEFVEFGEDKATLSTSKALSKPLFYDVSKAPRISTRKTKIVKGADFAKRRREELVANLQNNTRMKIDPFLIDTAITKSTTARLAGKFSKDSMVDVTTGADSGPGLVDYDSD